jgi:hypothetical protein
MSNTSKKADYPVLEREYITAAGTPSLRKMAEAVGISNSTLSDYARKHNWSDKRQRFLDTVDEEFIRTSAHARARKLAELSERSVDVLEAMLIRVGQQIAGDGFPRLELSPRDALDVIRQISVARGDPSDIVGEKNVTVHTIDPRLINALGNLAGRALSGGAEPRGAARGADLLALPGRAEGAEAAPAKADSA